MKILITGANGFIGTYLAKYFSGPHEVIASSRSFHPATRELLSTAALIEADVLDTKTLGSLNVEANVLIHVATANDILSKDPAKGVELSAIGTRNMLDFAVRNRIPQCIVFSTFQVYGSELTGLIDENAPLLFQNDYGLNHVYAEMYSSLYSRQGKVQAVAVRPSNVYGPIISGSFNRWSLVPGCFCKEAHESATITIRSSGKQMRNFVHLENLSRGVDAIISHFPRQYECYNLASSQTLSMISVAKTVKQAFEEMYGKKLELKVTGSEPAAGNEFSVSLEKLKDLGFAEAKDFNLDSAIRQIFNYLKSN